MDYWIVLSKTRSYALNIFKSALPQDLFLTHSALLEGCEKFIYGKELFDSEQKPNSSQPDKIWPNETRETCLRPLDHLLALISLF